MSMKLLNNLFNYLPISFKTEVVLKSISDQLKLLAWAMSGINYLLGDNISKWQSVLLIIPSWLFWQYLGHYILTKINPKNGGST